jgi:hypothetical protein
MTVLTQDEVRLQTQNVPSGNGSETSRSLVDRKEFIETVFAVLLPEEQVCIAEAKPRSDGDGTWFNSTLEKDRFWRKWKEAEQAKAVYFCVSTVDGAMNEKGTMVSRKRSNLIRSHLFVADDIGTKTGEPDVAPSYKLETSEGNFQWGYFLEPTDRLAEYEALVEAIHDLGWGDGGAGGSYRLMRVPGSANMKPGREEFRSRVTEWEPDRVWTLDKLAEEFGLDLKSLPVKDNKLKPKKTGESIDPMLNWLSDNGHVIEDHGEWVDVVCPWSDQHTNNDIKAGYSPLGRGEGDWAHTRGWNCLHEHCKGRKLKHFVEKLEPEGAPFVAGYDPLPYLQDRYAYIGMGQEVADLHQRKVGGNYVWSLADWSKRHTGKITMKGSEKKVPLATAFVSSRDTTHLDYSTYIPVSQARDTGVMMVDGQKVLNTYVPPNWQETSNEPEMFIEHMDYLVPDRKERETVLDWLAYKFQNPDRRSYAVVMVADGVYGTGRSWLKNMIELALQGKVNTASLPQLIGKGTSATQNYNDWMANCQFIVVEEAKETIDKKVFYEGYETFKQIIDIRVGKARINPKYDRTRTEGVYFNALIFTNHKDALAFPENDRRIYVAKNPSEMNTPEYYMRLEQSLNRVEAARLYWWLMRRDVSKFDNVYPPMTPAKMVMIAQNRAPSDEILDHIVANSPSDITTREMLGTHVHRAASALGKENIRRAPENTANIIWRGLDQLRHGKNGARYSVNGTTLEVKALRNHQEWKINDENRDREAFEKELSKYAQLSTHFAQ